MIPDIAASALYIAAAGSILRWLQVRLRLSRAKHPSLRGHSRLARRAAGLVRFYEFDESDFFRCDEAPENVACARERGFEKLKSRIGERSPKTIEMSESLESGVSDVLFTSSYRVPFQFRGYVKRNLKIGSLISESSGRRVKDLDGNWSYDLSGSYGVNVFGYDFYKECIDEGIARVSALGPVLGSFHPLIAENVARLKQISGLEEVSFHMSGTEAVMQAVRLARYHTGRTHLVRFCGAYHGWWDGVQPGIGNERAVDDVYTLKDMHEDTLKVLRTRKDIACVLVNPVQAMHPNTDAPGDATLISGGPPVRVDRQAYSSWLHALRETCTSRSIVLIFDEVFVGFRLAHGGAQEYFGVPADMVTYGKTLGGGLPIGVVCGKAHLMKRFRDDRPTQICFARGTFNSHPYVMATMNEFLRRIDRPEFEEIYSNADGIWDERAARLNERLESKRLPVRVANISSIWTTVHLAPSRYNWMFQFYLRDQGLNLSWIGSGRFIFSLDFTETEFEDVANRFVAAAEEMQSDRWWWHPVPQTNQSIKRQVLKEIFAAGMRDVIPGAEGGRRRTLRGAAQPSTESPPGRG